jgi:tRNA modification GTPase
VTVLRDTIVAVGTPSGRGALGVLRLSGPLSFSIAETLSGRLPPPREAGLRAFHDAGGEVIDRGLLLRFAGPNSYTGEDLVEFQTHGSPVVLQLLRDAVCALGARLARPGEFSERAFLNGRLDLAQAEAVADLIDASHRGAVLAANRSLEGLFSRRVQALVESLTQLRIYVEGALDFSDEDIDWLADAGLHQRLIAAREALEQLLREAHQGRRLRDGLVVAIAGRPNAGKSTLLNRLSGSDAAIVTDRPGTTRDLLREHLLIGNLPLTVIDTAGLRQTDDPVEQEGIRRARAAIAQAELVLYLVDDREGQTEDDRRERQRLPATVQQVLVHTKADLSGAAPARWRETDGHEALRLSVHSGEGMALLENLLHEVAGLSDGAEGLFTARARHLEALRRAQQHLADAQRSLDEQRGAELAAEDLRLAQQQLATITGAFSADDLLGRIFGSFCIGK